MNFEPFRHEVNSRADEAGREGSLAGDYGGGCFVAPAGVSAVDKRTAPCSVGALPGPTRIAKYARVLFPYEPRDGRRVAASKGKVWPWRARVTGNVGIYHLQVCGKLSRR